MKREQQVEFCKKCSNRKFEMQQGIICGLTGKLAEFETNCEQFVRDEQVVGKPVEVQEIKQGDITAVLDPASIEKLRAHQDFYYAVVGGLLAMLIAAILWTVISVSIERQIGYMAIGVGFLVGITIRYFGAGIEQKFGFLAGALSLFGCILGNFFSQVGFVSSQESISFFSALSLLWGKIGILLAESFSPIDLLFYGLALYTGYRFSFRPVTTDMINKLAKQDYRAYPTFNKLRLPLVIVCILLLGAFMVKITLGANDMISYKYDSGNVMSKGQLVHSKEQGKWVYYYENGNLQAEGFFKAGIPDSTWQWHFEDGTPAKHGSYVSGLESGIWINYYPNGQMSDSGTYVAGRKTGFWKGWHENGSILLEAFFNRDKPDKNIKKYHDNGQLSETGEMVNGIPNGTWINYFRNGKKASELQFVGPDSMLIQNSFDSLGNRMVIAGEGIYNEFSSDGHVIESGTVSRGHRVGRWIHYYNNGKRMEIKEYKGSDVRILDSWSPKGLEEVKKGNGIYTSWYEESTQIYETGEIREGLRNGLWKTFYESNGNLQVEAECFNGMINGNVKYYFETGELYSDGEMLNNKQEGEWTWYFENGQVSSTATFKNGEKEGTQVIWNELGKKVKEEYYKGGVLDHEKTVN
jgi:antitoxin component YwqK of YwqJK toxin-antitoxin module